MNSEQFKQLVEKVKIAKKLPDAIYFHKDAFADAPLELVKFIKVVAQACTFDKLQAIFCASTW